ncbi:AcrR family transcriptional regulator [Nocardia transvalensis]|uniref:AcrR family transcriptional regulator n=1 Tax=Nocardia transvalensis TaxID=37333 RepID=A0A7W9P8Q1_9NOCA|nr:AcrR family transcriptional regulator [Nocardia transvalensis]
MAGVGRATFYFHFPTKGHVLLELALHEEARVAPEFDRFLDIPVRWATGSATWHG